MILDYLEAALSQSWKQVDFLEMRGSHRTAML